MGLLQVLGQSNNDDQHPHSVESIYSLILHIKCPQHGLYSSF
jgi:hypothetical protein